LNHFAELAIVNKLLIIEDCPISARGKIGPPQSDAGSSARGRPDRAPPRRCERREEFYNGLGSL